jgi:hypothetical protein
MARVGDSRGVCRVLLGKPERKRSFVRPSCRWEDDFKMYLQVVGWGDTDWIDLVLDTDR